uniref:Immunoglobulin superfamily member 10 n=1 Tax=Pelodiscus sinensis TaxID=13735 RepID=K7FKL2_PELSI|nr:immunoglobulin superfamily member 10 isoform X1 [Pelodiscus sinensis]|eukprot:XP_006116010.1 immunoglobulin superfamily member 10 isoform X1 [Pelodiscus sinensis]
MLAVRDVVLGLARRMKVKGRAKPCLLEFLFSVCLATLPSSSACPQRCACYVPTEVHCTFRYLKAIPPHIPQNVERINLGYNSLVKLTETDFSGLEKLELLMLHSNEIHTIPNKTFTGLKALQVLKMSYNKVRILQKDTFHGLKSLVRLHMDHNQIEFVHPEVFYLLTSLRLVHLEGNLLKQLHPDTFVTLRYIQIFKTSSIKHIYLSDNFLTSLPQEMFSYLPELESIYLHGNPWSCDCNLQWFVDWAEQWPDIIKCKKDRSSSSAQQCPVCANPRHSKGKHLVNISSAALACSRPIIDPSLKLKNITVPDEGNFISISPEDFIAPIGTIMLNITDQTGNQADLVCNVQKPTKMSPISFDKDGYNTVLKVSFSTFLVCSINYEYIQQLWSILALYSDSPLKLERNLLLTKVPYTSYKYKQMYSENEDVFTNVESEVRAEPSWLLQDQVALKLDRMATTLSTLHIQYVTDAQIVLPRGDEKQLRHSWALISRDNKTRTEHSILVGRTMELDCQALGEPSPTIEWILADGSKVRAPYISEDGRILIAKSGKFTLQTADSFDTGVYHCIATNYNSADVLTFRITVIDPSVEHDHINGAQLLAFIGDTLYLPCQSVGVPDASVSWILPDHTVLHHSVQNKYIFHNSTLKIQEMTERDSGYFRCVAANQYGIDFLIFQVLGKVNEAASQEQMTAPEENEERDGSGHEALQAVTKRKYPLAIVQTSVTVKAPTDSASRNQPIWNNYREMTYRHNGDKINRRFRGHRRKFTSTARRIDPQHWAAFLEKTKKNSTLPEKQENAAIKSPTPPDHLSSKMFGNKEETSGDHIPPEEEFMTLPSETPTIPTLKKVSAIVVTGEPDATSRNTKSKTASVIVTEAVATTVSPWIMQSIRSKTKPAITRPNSLETSELNQTSLTIIQPLTSSSLVNSTAKDFNAEHRLVSFGQSNQYLQVRSTTPTITNLVTSQNTVEKPNLFTDSIYKTSTKSNNQFSMVTASEPNNEFGHLYFHSTQKVTTPKLQPWSTNITHQQIQIIRDATTNTPQSRQRFGRRRKISGRRRIVRPDRIPVIRGHRYNFVRQESNRESTTLLSAIELYTKCLSCFHLTTPSQSSLDLLSPKTHIAPSLKAVIPELTSQQPTSQTTAFLDEEKNRPTAEGEKRIPTVVPFYHENTQGTLQREQEANAPLQTYTDRILSFSVGLPATAKQTPNVSMEITTSSDSKTPSDVKSVSPTTETSSRNLRGKNPWHHLFGKTHIQKKKLPRRQTSTVPPTAIPIMLPKTTATLSKDRVSPLHLTTISVKVNQAADLLSLAKPINHDNSMSEKFTPSLSFTTTKLPSPAYFSKQVTVINKEMNATKTVPSFRYVTHTETKMTKIKAFRPGRKREQRRKKPQKIMTSQSTTTTSSSTTTAMSANTGLYIMTTAKSLTKPTIPMPTESLYESTSSIPIATVPQPQILSTKDVSKGSPATATQTPPQALTRITTVENAQHVELPSDVLITEKLAIAIPAVPPYLKPFKTTTILPAPSFVTSESVSVQPTKTITMVSEKPHQKVGQKVIQQKYTAKATFPDRAELRTKSPAVTTYVIKPSIHHSTPLASQTTETPRTSTLQMTLSPLWENKFWHKLSPEVSEIGKTLTANTLTILKSPQSSSPSTPAWGKDKDNSVKSWSDKTADQEKNNNRIALDSLYRNRLEKPRIVGGKLAAFTVLANSDAFIPCEATGNPLPTIHWTKVSSGIDVSKSKRDNRFEVFANGTLSIQNVNIQDRGQYLCIAANQHGSDRLLVTLSVVAYPPRILEGRSKVITIHSGKPVAVKCRAEGRPNPTISWILANKTHVSESSPGSKQASVQPDGTLIIKAATVYDRGLYTCMASNPAGADTLTVKLQVIVAPPIILEEKRQHIAGIMGESLKLPCTAKGNPHPSVHWVLFDGTVVKPLHFVNAKLFLFSNGTLYIRNIAPSDSGNYECIATSSTGSERRVVNLTVEQRDTIPRIATTSLKMTQLNFGDRLLLNCSATGEPKPRIIWRLPSKAVVDQWHRMGSRIHVYPNGSLFIEAVTEKDAGDYLCVARNRIGDDLILMKVSVTMKPAKIDQKQYFKKQVPYGKDFKMDCKASGSPEPEISWSLPDGTMINNVMQADDSGHRSQKYILFDNGTLYFNKVGKAEEGDYTCYAQNTLGKDEMKVHITVIAAAPRIMQNYKTHAKVKAGDNAVFDCEVVGEPKPKIFWLLPSSDLISASTDRYLLHINGSLSVSKVKLLDAGEYVCVARNLGGDDTKLYKLDVVSKPPLINGLYTNKTVIKTTAIRHSKKQIDCMAEGTPSPQIMWIMPDNIFLTAPYYGSRITVHKNGTLEIRNVRPSDTADFICVVRNDGGESILVVQLEVLEMLRRPMFKNPFNEKIIAKAGKTIILNCSVDGNPPPDIIWILPNGTRISSGARISQHRIGSNGTLIISDPSRDDAGRYRCAARNKVGYIEKLIILEVVQKPIILTNSRGLIKRITGESLSLHCLSDGSPKPNIIWTVPSGFVLDRPQITGKYILLENGTLVIQEATIHDRGNYMCKAQNNAGESSITVPVVTLAYPPRITNRPPQSIRTMTGAAVQLHCMALGIPKPEITWELPDHSVLSPTSKSRSSGSELLHPQGTLVIQNPKSSDSGMYKCTAQNQFGSDFTTTYIQVV